jgi:hypothetical protein
MQFHGTAFPLYEPGNRIHELVNNGNWCSIINIVTRLRVVIPSSLGSVPSRGIPYKQDV